LRDSRKKYARRRRHAERRGMVLGEMISMKARAVVLLDNLQALLEEIGYGTPATIEMIENAEFQFFHLFPWKRQHIRIN
jgi:hypothetical protein